MCIQGDDNYVIQRSTEITKIPDNLYTKSSDYRIHD